MAKRATATCSQNRNMMAFILISFTCASLITVKASWTNDEIGHIEGKETVAIETARVTLRQHKSFGNIAISIYVTKIGPCEETIVTS